ncbi:MAG: disulfide bond formation protein [Ilumatobacteraceae bacterium]|jgi:disulfide bond formation protein DsbB|nr:disulfide bond formation protein [Ilumatobacteraceae bacterium]
MNTPAVQTFCALLALLVLAFTLGLVVWRMSAWRSAGAARVVDQVGSVAPGLAAAIAVGCTAGSLYFSEVAHFLPCTLCWYQRIAMYPLALTLTMAAIRRDRSIRPYVAVLAGIGALISTYHWLLERFPSLDTGACSSTIPCEYIWFEKFGFVTLPFMAGCGFLAILVLVTLPDPSSAGRPDRLFDPRPHDQE